MDEWTTVQKETRRRRPQRRRNRKEQETPKSITATCGHNHGNQNNATAFFQNAVAAQLRATVNDDDTVTQQEIEDSLDVCLTELRTSRYWESLRKILASYKKFESIVAYGIGNFGTKRPSAPLWQLALAVLIREQQQEESIAMHYFEPLMTPEESKVLTKLNISIIQENERGKRSIDNNNNDDDDDDAMTLFFMPHCPLQLYTNLFHTNWDFLSKIVVFGNSLDNYIDGGNTNIVTDPQKKQALNILETLQPVWKIQALSIQKKDILELSAYFEQAFNDSSLTSFKLTTESWPDKPHLETPIDGGGEIL